MTGWDFKPYMPGPHLRIAELSELDRERACDLPTLTYPDEWCEPLFRIVLAKNPDEEEWDNIWEFATAHTRGRSEADLAGFLVAEPQAFDLYVCHDIERTARDFLDEPTLAELVRLARWTLIANTCLQLLVEWDVRPIRGVPEYWLDE